MFRLSCQRVLILDTLQLFLADSQNVCLRRDLWLIAAELNYRLVVVSGSRSTLC